LPARGRGGARRIQAAQGATAGAGDREKHRLFLSAADVFLVPENGGRPPPGRARGGGDAHDDRRRHVRPHLRQVSALEDRAAAAEGAEDLPHRQSVRRAGDAVRRQAAVVRSEDLQMTPRRKISLAKFVAATLVTVTTLMLMALGIYIYDTAEHRQRTDLEDYTRVQANGLAEALAVPVWNIDRPVINKVLDAMAQPKSVWGISVTAGDDSIGRRRDAKWKIVPGDGVGPPARRWGEARGGSL